MSVGSETHASLWREEWRAEKAREAMKSHNGATSVLSVQWVLDLEAFVKEADLRSDVCE